MKTVERRGVRGKWASGLLAACALWGMPAAQAQELSVQDPTQLIWLTGHWVQSSERGRSDEVWLAPTSAGMVGMNQQAFASGGRFFEFLRIEPLSGRLSYMASPMGRSPTVFALESAGPCTVAFVNSAHDFPQRIEYRREGTAMIASISGIVRGEPRQSQWRWALESGGDPQLCAGTADAVGEEMESEAAPLDAPADVAEPGDSGADALDQPARDAAD